MSHMATVITTLYTLPRRMEWQAIDSTGKFNVIPDVVRVIADWADCPLSSVDFDDNDMVCVDGEPVAFLEREYVRANATVDLRPMLQAAE
jgi:hypothetical protein